MKPILTLLLFSFLLHPDICRAQENSLPQNFLFDDSDIIIKAPEEKKLPEKNLNTEENINNAVNSARSLLNQRPVKLQQKAFPKLKISHSKSFSPAGTETKDAPFGLLWGATITDTRNQGVQLSSVEMKDYTNSFLATRLPKPIAFFERIYVVYGKEDELYRVLAYSKLIDDDSSASKILKQYQTYSDLLNKKYGNKDEEFTPATIRKTIKNSQGKEETVEEAAPLGNPDFLNQLENGTAVLFSTYYNDEVVAALSIGVDGNKKSYIVIDYKNLKILEKQEAKTLDAL